MSDPSEPAASAAFDRNCLEVLKAIGKALGQMNLYTASHPAVKAITAEAAGVLANILSQLPEGALTYSMDRDKVIANGRIIGTTASLPSSVSTLFARFKLNSMAFQTGVSAEEIGALCQMAAMKPEAAKGIDAAKHLSERGVAHILLNEAVYAQVDKETSAEPPPSERAKKLVDQIQGQSVEDAIRALVKALNLPPDEEARILELVLSRIREDIERHVQEATKVLRGEKNVAENAAARTQSVVGNQADGVIVVDERGNVLMMNPEAETMVGRKMAELVGKPLAKGLGPEHMLSLAQEIQTPSDRAIKADVETAGGPDSQRTLRASTAVVRNEAGMAVGIVAALSDKAKHREIDKVEREFVAHVTHELRAPLTSIKAALELLEDMFRGRLKEEEARMMNNAVRNSERLEELIRGILDFSKIESGQMTVYPKPCDAAALARDSTETMTPWTQKKGIRLAVEVAPGTSKVKADVSRTTQILVNLLSNAIKFTPKAGTITVRVGPGGGTDAAFHVFSVQDTGPGIPLSEQNRIFEKFQQIAQGEQHVGGTGLGLAIAKALVQLQGGRMWLDSSPGRGARFYFTLPRYVVSGGTQPPPTTETTPLPWWKRLLRKFSA
ncbi:MAG TPA: ATP-binding protein [Elusimicrobiota bacterium]|jgi:PAS domain S-box-containing protein|nr:ATP-binding protein [Elusimicrobiota bacterium]